MAKKLKISEEDKIEIKYKLGLELALNGHLGEAIEPLTFAAERGNTNAMSDLGNVYKILGNYDEAFKWTYKSACLNNPTGISNLCVMYRGGQGTPCSLANVLKWGDKLIELGYRQEGNDVKIACCFEAKDESELNYELGIKLAKEETKRLMEENPNPKPGDYCSCVGDLAAAYFYGRGVDIDDKEALKYFNYCYKCRNINYIYIMAQLLIETLDEEISDKEEGIRLFNIIGEYYNGDAYYTLGKEYEDGEFLKMDIEKAKEYYIKAITSNNAKYHYEDAKERLRALDSDLYKKVCL